MFVEKEFKLSAVGIKRPDTMQSALQGFKVYSSSHFTTEAVLLNLFTYRNISDVITADIKDCYLRAATNFPIINLGQTVVVKPQKFEFSHML